MSEDYNSCSHSLHSGGSAELGGLDDHALESKSLKLTLLRIGISGGFRKLGNTK